MLWRHWLEHSRTASLPWVWDDPAPMPGRVDRHIVVSLSGLSNTAMAVDLLSLGYDSVRNVTALPCLLIHLLDAFWLCTMPQLSIMVR